MKSRRSWWLIFGACALAAGLALAWITMVVLRLEAEAQHQASVRLALWRMDSWLGPRLARESTRAYFEYLPFYAQQRAYTKILNPIEKDEVYSPSPLLTFQSEFFPLHFQVDSSGAVSSPQVPEGNWRDLAESGYLDPGAIERRQPLLDRVRLAVNPPRQLEGCVAEAETLLAQLMRAEPDEVAPLPPPQAVQQWAAGGQQGQTLQSSLSKADVQKRAQTNAYQQESVQSQTIEIPQQTFMDKSEDEAVQVGALVPLWLVNSQPTAHDAAAHDLELLFVRRVRIGERTLYQGMLADWPALQRALLEQIADLIPKSSLEPLVDPKTQQREAESGRMLAGVPVLLGAPCPAMAAGPLVTPARTTLAITWLAVALAVAAAGVTLRASIHYGEKRSRFASAVTHELRTPLTTFRMYSEMLAEGMVRDEAQRQAYLQTLKSESGRLATLVENVLSYARLEDGRAVSHAQSTTVGGLLQRVEGVLTRRACDARMKLSVENAAPNDAAIKIDAEVVGQILFNLVDNACKYAGAAADGELNRTIHLSAAMNNGTLTLAVRDHGPGIAPEHSRRIFAPFDRGAHKPGDTIPGVGLGLALARGLARDLGGELQLQNCDGGACFRLTLPTQR